AGRGWRHWAPANASDPRNRVRRAVAVLTPKRTLAVFALSLVLLGGCTTNPLSTLGAAPSGVTVVITASEFRYEPATITVRTGQAVHLTFRNASTTMVHELRLKD